MALWCVRGGRGRCVAAALLAAGILAFPAPRAAASEPYGHVLLQADWRDDGQAAGPGVRRLRLSLQASVPLDDAELTVTLPASFAVKAVEPTWDDKFHAIPASGSQRAIRAPLDRLDAEKWLNLEFELVLPSQGGGVISFSVEGRTSKGRRVRDAIGLVARDSGSSGVLRLDAVEFPATVRPPEDPR